MSRNILQDIKKVKNTQKNEGTFYHGKKKEDIRDRMNEFPKEVFLIKKSSKSNNKIENIKGNSHYAFWAVAFFAIIFLFFAFSTFFSSALIDVNPKIKDLVLDKNFKAEKNSTISLNDIGSNASFDLVILSGEEEKIVKAEDEKDYLETSKGTILIYNAFSSSPQTLLSGTKLEGSNGKIYKIKNKIIIPGISKSNIPGKASVDISALEPGEDYDSLPLDFRVSSFNGTSKYQKIYARSVGEITGGLKGKYRKVSDIEKEKTLSELKDKLFIKLFNQAREQTPENFILFKNSDLLNIDEEGVSPTREDGNATVKIKGTLTGFLFNEKQIAKNILKSVLDEAELDKINNLYISNISDLRFSITDKDVLSFAENSEINFNLSGQIKIVWKIDSTKIISDILGKNKKDFNKILSKYENIESADLKIKPVWQRSFPDKSKDIKIIVNYPK